MIIQKSEVKIRQRSHGYIIGVVQCTAAGSIYSQLVWRKIILCLPAALFFLGVSLATGWWQIQRWRRRRRWKRRWKGEKYWPGRTSSVGNPSLTAFGGSPPSQTPDRTGPDCHSQPEISDSFRLLSRRSNFISLFICLQSPTYNNNHHQQCWFSTNSITMIKVNCHIHTWPKWS